MKIITKSLIILFCADKIQFLKIHFNYSLNKHNQIMIKTTLILVAFVLTTTQVLSQEIIYSSFIGGNGSKDVITNILTDNDGYVYLTGFTNSTNLPVTEGAYDLTRGSGTSQGDEDMFVMKLTPQMDEVIYCTYIGGAGPDFPWTATVDDDGCVLIAGQGYSNFPRTANAFQNKFNGPNMTHAEGIFCKLSADGSNLIYSTHLGGQGNDWASVLTNGSGRTYVGITCDAPSFFSNNKESTDFLTDARNIYGQPENGGRFFILVFDQNFNVIDKIHIAQLSNVNMCIDDLGNLCIIGLTTKNNLPVTENAFDSSYNGGNDIYIMKLNPNLDTILYASYLGGTGDEKLSGFTSYTSAFNSSGQLFIAGITKSNDFPVTDGTNLAINSSNGFVACVDINQGTLSSSAVFGDGVYLVDNLLIDDKNRPIIYGVTTSTAFPCTNNALNKVYHGFDGIPGDEKERFVTVFSPDLAKVEYASYACGMVTKKQGSWGCASIGANGNIFISSVTNLQDFPVTENSFDQNFNGGLDSYLIQLRIDNPTGSSDIKQGGNFKIYPNPANNQIHISNSYFIQDVANYSISDLTGKNLQSGNVTSNSIDVSPLKEGFYILNLNVNNEFISKKILIQ